MLFSKNECRSRGFASRILCVRHAVSLNIEKSLTNWFQLLEQTRGPKGLSATTWPPRKNENTLRTSEKGNYPWNERLSGFLSSPSPSVVDSKSDFEKYRFCHRSPRATIGLFITDHLWWQSNSFPIDIVFLKKTELEILVVCFEWTGTFIIIAKDIWHWVSPKYSHNILISRVPIENHIWVVEYHYGNYVQIDLKLSGKYR